MSRSNPWRVVVGLILAAVVCTLALWLQEQRSAPLTAYSPASLLLAQDRVHQTRARLFHRAFWLEPWPWIAVGLAGFGLLAWGIVWGIETRERDR